MTPKEKARELVDKYCYALRTEEREDGFFTNIIQAKECAFFAIVLHLEELRKMKLIVSARELHYEYWKEVKQEIENYETK